MAKKELKTYDDFLKAGYIRSYSMCGFYHKDVKAEDKSVKLFIPPFGITDKMLCEGWVIYEDKSFKKPIISFVDINERRTDPPTNTEEREGVSG